jgi:aminopeptidase-like protein
MIRAQSREKTDFESTGRAMYELVEELFPLTRSITGPGVRETLKKLRRHIPLREREVPSGTQVFDWTVPREWHIRDAYVKDAAGKRVIDFRRSNLHVVNYSVPIKATMSLDELKPHLHTLPNHPTWIPYRTSYYESNWGFCLSYQNLLALDEGPYEVCIDATLNDGAMTYGELYLPGQSEDEFLLSSHVCHPSLANDNLSAVAVATFLARHLATEPRRYSYRFLFAPGTIGALAWLARNEQSLGKIRGGLVLALLGDPGKLNYKKSRRGDADIDRIVSHVLEHSGEQYDVMGFEPFGYDERQFCSPGFNLPVGRLTRTPHGQYAQYHTSADNLDFVRPEYLADSLAKCMAIIDVFERNQAYVNLNPKGEPQLSRRGLYESMGGRSTRVAVDRALPWVLNLSDESHTLLDIAERSGLAFDTIHQAAQVLTRSELLTPQS